MNVQVLKDIPSDQLIPSMRYITVALGVHCDFCHDAKSYDSDDKPAEGHRSQDDDDDARHQQRQFQRAPRSHLLYMPPRHFESSEHSDGAVRGRRESVPAKRCLRRTAARRVRPLPSPSVGNAASVSAASMPTVDDILAKYTEALGGSAAIRRKSRRSPKRALQKPRHAECTRPMDVFRKAPNKALAILHAPPGDIAEGFNGTMGWHQRPGHGSGRGGRATS